jgi:hypothetical protein
LAQAAFETSHTLKPIIYALAKNKLLLRLSNMEDSFDRSSSQVTFDVNAFAHQLFKEANPNHSGKVQIQIEETTLTGSSNLAKRNAE